MTNARINHFCSHAGKVKIIKLHYENLSSALCAKIFETLWKKEVHVSILAQLFEITSFHD